MKFLATLGIVAGLSLAAVAPGLAQDGEAADRLNIETNKGSIVVQLRPDLAPKHVEQIKTLAGEGAYDNVVFHRVIDGFMAQTGDVEFGKKGADTSGAGMGGSDKPDLEAEFSEDETFDRGTVGMARSQDPNSANSQFFIMLADGDFLDGQYTIVGDVVEGMDVVDQIKKGDARQNGSVEDPDVMTKVTVGGSEG
ncbi:peptidylprolyl isomerase [Fulvimarina sp. 2208YS6-2-32]|uniref:Peptidyl-prolyl cis-trans isomerase n=1 Tax=Fulvimarina uroteuthidis TaxID=3098149 RepID=A0ABU5I3T2_9HYPH|nr:peptidylprolyl isomerase [Fulvimarina sp. 2208YS6-2-32]MDY8110042.1 peptidylprolyl isomerase [Fulvimarina sp. 2208YS6-2-32]